MTARPHMTLAAIIVTEAFNPHATPEMLRSRDRARKLRALLRRDWIIAGGRVIKRGQFCRIHPRPCDRDYDLQVTEPRNHPNG